MGARAAPVLAALLAVALVIPVSASAHGDPTAHYLETDSLLTSYAAPPDIAVELQLRGVLDAAAARGYPIKVVLFANEGDTGGELEPLEDTQAYATAVSAQLAAVRPLRAPVLIVTPDRFGVSGGQPPAPELADSIPLAKQASGNALARASILAVRRLAASAGHPLPDRIPPAKNNLTGILGGAAAENQNALGGPWLIAAVALATIALGALLVTLHRRMVTRERDVS
jgi:hypothetical protein